ncbi:MAG: CHRD domain-containing protein [Planctomycetota bacterium]|nr:CHRD domain-containing protein [Planctomycetota bacterium]
MLKFCFRVTAFSLLVLSVGGVSSAGVIPTRAILNGASESPANASPGTGIADVDFDTTAHTMHVHVTFSGLLGGVTAAHIHAATASPFTGTASVATQTPSFVGFPSGVTSGSYDHTFDLTLASTYRAGFITANGGSIANSEAALLSAATHNTAYLNLHTNVVPSGEIRGFLTVVPEPSSFVLGGFGLVAVGFWTRRNRRKVA